MRIAVVGSRSYPNLAAVRQFVWECERTTVIVSGGAQGVDRWRSKLGGAPLRLFEALLSSRGQPVTAETLGQISRVNHTVSTFRLAVTKLKKLDLLTDQSGMYTINEELL